MRASKPETIHTRGQAMSDNTAILAGFTREVMANSDAGEMHIFIKPDADLDGRFKAYNADDCEWVVLNGWLWSFDEIEQYPQG
jgi:hypothetical protein